MLSVIKCYEEREDYFLQMQNRIHLNQATEKCHNQLPSKRHIPLLQPLISTNIQIIYFFQVLMC